MRPRSRDAIAIHHLLNAPDGDDFAGRFPIRDNASGAGAEEDVATIGEPEDSSEASHWSGEDYEQNDVFIGADLPEVEGINFDSFFGGFETLTFGAYPLHPDLSQMTSGGGIASPAAMALETRAFEIRQLLLETAAKLTNDYPGDPQIAHLVPAIELLTHVELDHCLNLFFGNYHRHCPILHRPSFQPTLVPIPLLLTAAALGGMYSPEPVKVAWMKSLLDIIEAFIFSLPGIRDDFFGDFTLADPAADEETQNYRFQLFQGAYLMVVVQYFSGNLAGRRRARRQRFTTVLSVSLPCPWISLF